MTKYDEIEQYFNNTGAHIENEEYGGVYIGATDKVYFDFPANFRTDDAYYENCAKCMAFWAENKLGIVEDVIPVADAAAELICEQFGIDHKKQENSLENKAQAIRVKSFLDSFQSKP